MSTAFDVRQYREANTTCGYTSMSFGSPPAANYAYYISYVSSVLASTF